MSDGDTEVADETCSYRFSVGQSVADRDKSGHTNMVIVHQPGEIAGEWDVPGTGQTVADFNDSYPSDDLVSIVVFEQNLADEIPDWESTDVETLWTTVRDASVKTYAYPESRLVRGTASLPETIETYHELICYQHARLIQLAADISYDEFLWKRYHQLKDGEYEMASISKEDRYQLKEDFGVCIYCKTEADTTFDHLIPTSDGGPDKISNQVPACQSCNSSKGDRNVIDWCTERGEPVPRIVWGKYLKQRREQLAEQGKLHEEIAQSDRKRWDGAEIQRNITDRIRKRYTS
jgi:hypothetical protein